MYYIIGLGLLMNLVEMKKAAHRELKYLPSMLLQQLVTECKELNRFYLLQSLDDVCNEFFRTLLPGIKFLSF